MTQRFAESVVEEAALEWLEGLGYSILHGPEVAPDTAAAERGNFGEVVLAVRLRYSLKRLNPHLPDEAIEDAFRRLMHPEGATLEARNRNIHRHLIDGIT